jgi:hypothetical protein
VTRSVDWSLYLVTDRRLALPRAIEDVVTAAVRDSVILTSLDVPLIIK